MKNRIIILLALLAVSISLYADSIPSSFSRPLLWRVGVGVNPAYVPATNSFLEGYNLQDRKIRSSISTSLQADFSFDANTREGLLYRGLYQGVAVGVNSFYSGSLIGTPVSVYVYQGAPIVRFSDRLWFGYEWQFGAAFGWRHYDSDKDDTNVALGSSTSAHMGLAFKLNYRIASRWHLAFGITGNHFSNGNTSWPNAGVNSIGASIGMSYVLGEQSTAKETPQWLAAEADRGRWFYDITAFGSWRKRIVTVGVGQDPQLSPGSFGVLGLQFSPMRQLNRWVAAGVSLDFQWDESSGIEPYWVEGTSGDDLRFYRPPFGKQISLGLSAHAELTMPIFSVNVGIGYDLLSPIGNERFYQSLTLKTFVSKHIYLNTGYRLGSFRQPQNLMLGVGVRL